MGRWLGGTTIAVTLALLPQVTVPADFAATAAAATTNKDFPAAPEREINKVVPFKAKKHTPDGKAAKAAARTKERLKRAHWPAGGTHTLELTPGATDRATIGGIPVTLTDRRAAKRTTSSATAAASTVQVRVHDRKAATRSHVNGALLTITPQQTGDSTGRLTLDYSSFADAYGGSYGTRLHLVQLPLCALTTPQKVACRIQKPLKTDNNAAQQTLSADLGSITGLKPATPMLLAATAAASGSSGDFGATPLGPSATWEAGGATGDFTWNYPLNVPPATAGPAPNLAISYNSASVDGRTSAENNQTSVIGEGFSITESYIERTYGSCKDDGNTGKGDQCWKYANASLVLNGKAAELVNDCDTTALCDTAEKSQAAGGTWRLKSDDATKVEHLTGNTSNGDDNGEYWKVTTTDGTQYFFGKHRLPGWSDHGTAADDAVTDSTWTVPVFGDDAGEPCHGSTYAASSCDQAWRWNLDYVVDTHNNAMAYWYGKETNNYAKNGVDNPATPYVRGGYLKRIDYGLRSTSIYTQPAAQQVTFNYDQRCIVSGGCGSLTEATKANWPDVPFDQICADGKTCTGLIGPSFFTRYRLTDITTSIWTGTGTTRRNVDAWKLEHDFPDSGDASSPSLWLKSIQRTGKAASTDGSADITMPPVTFDGIQLANHVEGGGDTLRYTKWRVRRIYSETNAVTLVNYSDPQCIRGTTMPASEDKNTLRCFPVYWSQSGATPELDWFHKYVVTSIFEEDPTGGGDTKETRYTYSGGAGWGYSDDEGLTKKQYRTWNQWRGYPTVTTVVGDGEGPTSKTVNLYMRGLDGEKEKDGTARDEKVTDSTGTTIEDSRQYAGFVRETITYDGDTEVGGTINDPWSYNTAKHVYDWGTTEAWFTQPGTISTRKKTSTGTTTTKTKTTYDTTYGMPQTVEDFGDVSKTGDETCTTTSYARNTTDWLVQYVSRSESYAVGCNITPTLPDNAISDVTTGYDNQAVGVAPTKGETTSSYRLSGYTADKPTYQKVSTTTYDDLGRPETVTDALNIPTTTTYTPDDTGYGPLTKTVVTNIKSHTVTTDVDPAWGSATKVTDANNKITEWKFDSLGRLIAVWKPNRARLLDDAASIVYTYSLSKAVASWVRTDTLKADGRTYNSSYQIYDALLRERQTQVPAPGGGRIISETLYNDRGLAAVANTQVYDNKAPEGVLANTFPGSVPASTETVFDGAGRATTSIFRVKGQEKWRTRTDDQGDRVATYAAAGGTGTLTITDARGRVTERREYASPDPTGTDYTKTTYTYTPSGQIDTMTGPDNSVWHYTYDLRGRLIETIDPDKGTATTGYNDADQAISTTATIDGQPRTVLAHYDELGRKDATYDGVVDAAHQLTKYVYDTVAKGQLTSAIRYVDGTAGKIYTTQFTAYNNLYQPTTIKTVLAAADPLVQAGAAPQTFTTLKTYNLDGTLKGTTLPAAGGLPIEGVAYTYNDLGLVTSVTGSTGYVRSVGYTPYGEPEQTTLATSDTAKQLQVSNRYEDGTRRLSNTHTLDQTNTGYTSDVDYAYDTSGNVTSVANKLGVQDTQCFKYDGYRRLTEAWTPASNNCDTTRSATALGGPAPYWNSWTYKAGGLRDTQTVHTATGDTKTTYAYPPVKADGTGQPHTLTSTTTGGVTTGYTYDEQGNTTHRPGTTGQQTLTWNSESELATLSEGTKTTNYLYDAAGEILIRQGTTETVLYLPGQELHYDPVAKKSTAQRYYTAGDGTALRTNTGLSWIIDDHHGTANMVVDPATQAITRRYTKPFGDTRGTVPTTWPDDKAFLGKPADVTTGLTHIGAREYDPQVGRFLSVDPILASTDHESLNGYTYANNTPVTLADPTGLRPDGACGGSSSSCNGGTESWKRNDKGGWNWSYTKSYDTKGTYHGKTYTLTTVVTQTEHSTSATITFKTGPEPKPAVKYSGGAPYVNGTCVYAAAGNCGSATQSEVSASQIPDLPCGVNDGLCGVRNQLYKAGVIAGMTGGSLGIFSLRAGCSFDPSTLVLLENGKTKPIKKVKPGDRVEAGDPKTGKHRGARTVTATIVNNDDDLIDLTVRGHDGKNVTLHTTSEHPFWDDSKHTWVPASRLTAGHAFKTVQNRRVVLVAVRARAGAADMHNLTVADLHTYYVLAGATPVLVHNTCGVPGNKSGGFFSRLLGRGSKAADAAHEPNATVGDLRGIGHDNVDANGNWQSDPLKAGMARSMTDEQLLRSTTQPTGGEFSLLRFHAEDNYMIEGNHRMAELLRRAASPDYPGITFDTPIYIHLWPGEG